MVRVKITYANVVATMALVLALGGGAYATTSSSDGGSPESRAGDVLPSGVTQRGVFDVSGMQSGGATLNMQLAAVTFPKRLNFTPNAHLVFSGVPVGACPGTVNKPTAKRGHLCLYVGGQWNQGSVLFVDPRTQGSPGVTPWGFVLATEPYTTSGSFSFDVHGTWAVTAK